MDVSTKLQTAKAGFATLSVGQEYQDAALKALEEWYSDPQFADYLPQIDHLIESEHWDYLLDSFYQVIPFGTGGRRGEVGVGPNRINPWTIRASAQGHSQYLLGHYGDEAKERGIVLTYDVREFFTNEFFSEDLPNPVKNLTCRDLMMAAAEVYTGNGIKVFTFDEPRSTPELSFLIRHLKAVAGDMFSASHNPPEHNGKKVYDEFGGQLVPPHDEALVTEVTQKVTEMKHMPFEEAEKAGLVVTIGDKEDEAYIDASCSLSLSDARDAKIVYTPLHGTGLTSVYKVLTKLGFDVSLDPKTSNMSGAFENVTFNIPNPEVIQSFDTPLVYANEIGADLVLNSDPDADRIGIMVRHTDGEWAFFNGNEIAALLVDYAIKKKLPTIDGQGIFITTAVTTGLIRSAAEKNDMRVIDDLLVGYKYIGEEMNKLEKEGTVQNVLLSCEESHGYLSGDHLREKDGVPAAIWLAEMASEEKREGRSLVDRLRDVYATYGYFQNYLTEIRMPGAEGNSRIAHLQSSLRDNPPMEFGRFKVKEVVDFRDRLPIVSETDRVSKNVLVFHLEPVEGTVALKITVRPSGTEPKTKMYFEIGSEEFEVENYEAVRASTDELRQELERAFMQECYKVLDVEFPDRGFLLFWQLPLKDKLHYFEIEKDIIALKDEQDEATRATKLDELLAFLGSDPVMKVDKAFVAEYGTSMREYLELPSVS